MEASKLRKYQRTEAEPASELREQRATIIDAWKDRVLELVPGKQLGERPALLNCMPAFIDRLIEAIANGRTEREKSLRAAVMVMEPGEQRALRPAFTLSQVLIEYRILREVIFDVLKASNALTESAVDRIDDSIEAGMSSAATQFLKLRSIREAQARREVDELNRRLRGLQSVTDGALADAPSLQSLLYELLARVREIFESDTVVVLLLDQEKHTLVVCAAHGLEEEVKKGMAIPLGQGVAGWIYSEKRALIFDDLSKVEIFSPFLKEKALKSLMGAPLRTAKGVLGVIHVGTLKPRAFSLDEAALLQMIADRISAAIESSRLNEQRQKDLATIEAKESIGKRILSILTHDIRNPMTAAQFLSSMLLKMANQPDVVRSLSFRISQTLVRSDKLIQDLLDVSKIMNHESLSLEPEEVALHEIVSDVLVSFALLNGDRFVLREEEPIQVFWSRRELKRAFELALEIGLRLGKEQSPILISTSGVGNDVRISIHFSGAIEKPHKLESQFPKSIDDRISRRESRLSLSWTLIEGFVKAHQGSVSLESSEKLGTDISLTIPKRPDFSV